MPSQWPFLIPFVSMASGLTFSAQTGNFCSVTTLAVGLACLILASLLRAKSIFTACIALFFFLCGMQSLSPWLIPDSSPASIRHMTSDSPLNLEGIVASRPKVSPDGSSIIIRAEKLYSNNTAEPVQGLLMLYLAQGDVTFTRGDRIRCMTRISVPRRLGLPGEFDYPKYLAFNGISAIGRVAAQEDIVLIRSAAEESFQRTIDLVARQLGDAIRNALPDEKISSVLAALLIGDQRRIPRELAEAYTKAGVSHILSISGFHIGIIAAFITFSSLWLLTRFEYLTLHCNVRRLVVLLAVPSMFVYLLLTGNAPATARSVIMLAAFACALYSERESDPINTLLSAAFLLIAINPPTLFDLSFQLSFISLWGIIIAVPAFSKLMSAATSVSWRTFIQFIAASVAASGVTLIPVLFTFKVASLNGILTNFLVVPLLGYGAVLTGFCVLPMLLLFPSFNHVLLWPSARLIEVSNWIINGFASLPVINFHGITKWDMFFFLLFMCAITFIRCRKIRLMLGVFLPLTAISIHILLPVSSDGRLHITMFSVGQAESLFLRFPDGKTMLVDGGGYLHDTGNDFGQRILAPALGALGVKRIDWMLSTHDHPDHIGGLAFVARHFNVGEFWSASGGLEVDYSQNIRTVLSDQNIPVRKLTAGNVLGLCDGVSLTVLSPDKKTSRHSGGVGVDINEESLVFRISFGKFSMLFASDAGFAAENLILTGGYELESTVLKVGHHGSRYSTSNEFLGRVNPRLALISAGEGNRFGLPSHLTLDQLAIRKIPVYRTDRDGTIELVSDGLNWSVSTPFNY